MLILLTLLAKSSCAQERKRKLRLHASINFYIIQLQQSKNFTIQCQILGFQSRVLKQSIFTNSFLRYLVYLDATPLFQNKYLKRCKIF